MLLHEYICKKPSIRKISTAAAWQEQLMRVTHCLT